MKLVKSHCILQKFPSEFRLVVDVGDFLLLFTAGCSGVSIKLLWHRRGIVLQLLKKRGRHSQKVNTSKRFDLLYLYANELQKRVRIKRAHVTERSPHHDSFVLVLLVIIEDFLYRLNTRIFIPVVSRTWLVFLVPIKDLRI
jgi:hypothetical protein